jgi:hypothetical protein
VQRLENPFPIWLDQHGDLVDAGYIYVGTAGADPEVSPITVYWDAALSIVAPQPLRTRGGVIVNNGKPSLVFISAADYSVRVRDADGNEIGYTPSGSITGGTSYQPLDSDLTAIAALSTTAFGRSLLTAASAAGARTLIGVSTFTGGTVSSNILRSGAGPHLYHSNGAFTSGKVLATVNTAADPTTADGDIWLKYAP